MKKTESLAALQPINFNQLELINVDENGQMSLYPNSAAKTRGGVVNGVFYGNVLTNSQQEIDDTCERDGREVPIQTRIVLDRQIQVNVINRHLQEELNLFDWEVMDALATLSVNSEETIFLDSIYRVIVGKKNMYPVTEVQRNMVNESIEKMRHMTVELKIMDLFEKDSPINAALKQKGIRTGTIRNSLLPCEIKEYHDNTTGYIYGIRLLDTPPLFAYAKVLGLAGVCPLALIDTPLKKTRNIIVLQSYLLRSIDQMYRDRANNNESTMTVDTKSIYSVTGIVKNSDTEKARARKKTEQILEFWRQKGYIGGYSVIHATWRKTVVGYRIILADGNRHWNFGDHPAARLQA